MCSNLKLNSKFINKIIYLFIMSFEHSFKLRSQLNCSKLLCKLKHQNNVHSNPTHSWSPSETASSPISPPAGYQPRSSQYPHKGSTSYQTPACRRQGKYGDNWHPIPLGPAWTSMLTRWGACRGSISSRGASWSCTQRGGAQRHV